MKRLMKKQKREMDHDDLTDDLDVEIDTRPSNQRKSPVFKPEADDDEVEEEEVSEADDDDDGDYAPGRRKSKRPKKKKKEPKKKGAAAATRGGGKAKRPAEESSEEEAQESEFESDGEVPAGAADDDEEEDEEVVVERPVKAKKGIAGPSSSKKGLTTATLLAATSEAHDVDKILTWRWVQSASPPDAPPAAEPAGASEPAASEPAASEPAADAAEPGAAGAEPAAAEPPKPDVRPREFYVKWTGRSYHHCSWVEEARLRSLAEVKLRYFLKIREMSAAGAVSKEEAAHMVAGGDNWEEVVQPDWLKVERVLDRRAAAAADASGYPPLHAEDELLIKWRGLGYEGITWETGRLLLSMAEAAGHVADYEAWNDRARQLDDSGRKPRPQGTDAPFEKYEAQPSFLGGPDSLPLHRYQHEGLNWLRSCWHRNLNVMLADEMGLGKTVQTVALVAALHAEYTRGPFLVCVPLSTVPNWDREFRRWAPQLNCVTYCGSKEGRQLCRDLDFWFDAEKGARPAERDGAPVKLHVLISSYEIVLADQAVLKKVDWEALVVDEGHRLKSKSSKLFEALQGFRTNFRLLLTGTPLQNNLEELWTLLHFLQPEEFASLETFQASFESLDREDQIGKLHGMLAPHILRRVKADVLRDLIPKKKELMVRVELSEKQRTLYQAVLTKNFEVLQRKGAHKQRSLTNVVMELKKCANHPWLVEGSPPEIDLTAEELGDLVESSGKMQLLDLMLPKLKAAGHRVLVFSQMTKMLDILEDYLLARGYGFERLDGNVGSAERQLRIDRFNRDLGSAAKEKFVFLLSTRAGGLGINLATADTVVLYDSDWNPHNDIQALSRAHRLGQANKVLILRLVTRWSVEERIVQMAKKKMMMEHLVVRKMTPGANSFQAGELDDILRFGTAELFSEEAKEGVDRIVWDEGAVNRLLDRSQMDELEGTEDGEQQDGSSSYMDGFKVADYGKQEAEAEAEAEAPPADEEGEGEGEDYWTALLGERSAQYTALEAMRMGRGKRDRSAPLNYRETNLPLWQAMEADEAAQREEEKKRKEQEKEEKRRDKEERAAREAEKRAEKLKLKQKEWEPPPLLVWDGSGNGNYSVHGFSWRERRSFLKMLLRFGLLGGSPLQIHRMCKQDSELKRKRIEELTLYTNRTLLHMTEAQRDELDPAKAAALPAPPPEADEPVDGGEGEEVRSGRAAAAAAAAGPKYRDGCPVDKRSVEVGTVLRRLWLMELVRSKLVEAGLVTAAEATGEDEAEAAAAEAAAAAAKAAAAEKPAGASAAEARPQDVLEIDEAAAPAAPPAVVPPAAAPAAVPAAAPPQPATYERSLEPYYPLRFNLPPPEQAMDLSHDYVELATRPARMLRRGPKGWDLLCDKMLLLGVHKHGFCPGATPSVHWDALLDEQLGLLEAALDQVEPQIKQIADDRAATAAALAARLAAASPQAGAATPAAAGTPAPEADAEPMDVDEDDSDEDDRPLSSLPAAMALPAAAAARAAAAPAAPAAPAAGVAGGAPVLSPLMQRLERPNAKELVRQLLARRSRMLLQLLEAEHMLATAPRRRAAPARWTVGSAEMITPHEDDKKVSSLRMATSPEGVELVWEPPRVAELVPVEAMAYEVEYRFPEVEAAPEDPGLVTDVEDQRDGSWQRTHEHALREAHATLDMPFKEALAAGGVLRVRAFCGVFGFGAWRVLSGTPNAT